MNGDKQRESRRELGTAKDSDGARFSAAAGQRAGDEFNINNPFLSLLMQSIQDVIVLLEADGTIRYVSPANEKYSGYKSEELIGSSPLDSIHPDDIPIVIQALSGLLKEPGSRRECDYRIRHRDGGWQYVHGVATNLLDYPPLSAILLSASNVTDYKQAEKKLRDEQSFLEEALDSLNIVFYVLDMNARLLRWNKTFRQVSGYSDEELASLSVLDFFEDEDIVRQEEFFQTLVVQDRAGIEATVVNKDGLRIPFYFHSTLFRDGEGNPKAVCGGGIDISEKKQAETELEGYRKRIEELVEERTMALMQANEKLQAEITERKREEAELLSSNSELDAFAYSVSHDLRGSLSVIKGFAHSAIRAREDERFEDEMHCLSEIIGATNRMNYFIQSLLVYCEAGQAQGETDRVEPGLVLRDVIKAHKERIEEAGTELKTQNNLPAIEVEPVRLYQVLANLVENGLKYSGDNPRPKIEIGGREEDGEAIFFVRDNGMGIQSEDLHRIFEPFARAEDAGQAGLGIGLATVKRAVEGWGGKVWVDSTPGSGSTFFFTAPIANS